MVVLAKSNVTFQGNRSISHRPLELGKVIFDESCMLPDSRLYFAALINSRRETKNKLHKLTAILMIIFCAASAVILIGCSKSRNGPVYKRSAE